MMLDISTSSTVSLNLTVCIIASGRALALPIAHDVELCKSITLFKSKYSWLGVGMGCLVYGFILLVVGVVVWWLDTFFIIYFVIWGCEWWYCGGCSLLYGLCFTMVFLVVVVVVTGSCGGLLVVWLWL